jgi:hypothetical protein
MGNCLRRGPKSALQSDALVSPGHVMTEQIIAVLLPVFLIVGLGYVFGRAPLERFGEKRSRLGIPP